jgi:hypothetical protein
MAYNSSGTWQDEDAGVANRIAAITAGGSDYIKQARTSGMQAANRRGLGNSSMAVGAAEGAAIDRAAPIAVQEAGQINQRNLSGQEFRQQGGIANQNFTYQTELDKMRYAASEREMQARAITDLNSQRMQAFANTLQNDKIPAEARAEAQRSINDQQADAIARLEQLYGVSLSNSPPPAAGGVGMPPISSFGMPPISSFGVPPINSFGVAGASIPADTYAAYVQGNPDLMADFTRNAKKFGNDPAAYGRYHYERYGRNEGRQLPGVAPAVAPAAVPTAPPIMAAPQTYGLGNIAFRPEDSNQPIRVNL